MCLLKSNQIGEVGESEINLNGEAMIEEEHRTLEVIDGEEDEEKWLKGIRKAQQLANDVAKEHLLSKDTKHIMRAPKETYS